MKATCYHVRKQDGTKVLGGSLGMATGDNTDLNQAAEQLTRRMEIAVLPSGRVSFMHAGNPVFVYLSVDPAESEKGKAALVTDRRNGATDVRRNGASNRWVKRRPEGVKTGSILQPFEGWI